MRGARGLAAVLGIAALALSSCATLPPTAPGQTRPTETRDDGATTESDPAQAAAAEPPLSPVSAALLEQSRDARDAGRYAQAESALERALGIEPNNALLWIELAEVKAAQDDPDQAIEMARKALTLAGADRSIRGRAARLLP
jgi:tetratricopeptide (TPR) repeat protein